MTKSVILKHSQAQFFQTPAINRIIINLSSKQVSNMYSVIKAYRNHRILLVFCKIGELFYSAHNYRFNKA
jgi:hypothetical protein